MASMISDPDLPGDFDPIRGDGLRSIADVIFGSSMISDPDLLGDFDPTRGDAGLRSFVVAVDSWVTSGPYLGDFDFGLRM